MGPHLSVLDGHMKSAGPDHGASPVHPGRTHEERRTRLWCLIVGSLEVKDANEKHAKQTDWEKAADISQCMGDMRNTLTQ